MIKLETKFSSTIVVQETLLPNTWFVDIRLLANNSVNQKNYNIALDRIEFYVNEILDNSILLSPSASEMFNNPIGLKTSNADSKTSNKCLCGSNLSSVSNSAA